MNIYKDKRTGIFYYDFILDGKRIRKSLGTKSRSVALIKVGKLSASEKAANKTGIVTLETFLTRYRPFLAATRKPNTISRFEYALKKLLQMSPSIFLLQDITPSLLDTLAVTLKAQNADKEFSSGINRSIRALKTAMRQAEFWDMIPPQNWKKVSKFKEKKGRIVFHSPEEIAYLLEHLPVNLLPVVMLGARAGLRRSEMAALKWEDIDFENNQIYVAPNKTEKHRYVPMCADLRSFLEHLPHTTKYVVNAGTSRDSKYFLSVYYKQTTKDYPFKCFMHKLRHTFASHLVQSGVDLYRVSKLLGHSSIKMTEIYAHLAPIDLQNAVINLPDIQLPSTDKC